MPGTSSQKRVREHRARLRAQGLRPVQIWVPDVRAPGSLKRHTASPAGRRKRRRSRRPRVHRLGLLVARWVRRAEIWTVAGGSGYAGKPRPAVIIQDDRFDTDSVNICPFTTDLPTPAVPLEH